MITIDTPPEFEPWPPDMPSGGIVPGGWSAGSGTFTRDQMITAWRSWPPELRQPVMNRVSSPLLATGWLGYPKIWAGDRDTIGKFTAYQAEWGGLYLQHRGEILVGSLFSGAFSHEWAHLLDFELKLRTGHEQAKLTDDSRWRQLYEDSKSAEPDSGKYGHTNVQEFFAEAGSGWIARQLQWIAYTCDARVNGEDVRGPFTERALALLAEQLPYDGMDAILDATLP